MVGRSGCVFVLGGQSGSTPEVVWSNTQEEVSGLEEVQEERGESAMEAIIIITSHISARSICKLQRSTSADWHTPCRSG